MMRTLIICVLTILCGPTATAETGRLFFDLAGNGGNQSAAHPGGLAMENPAAGSSGRLYIYWQFGRPGGADAQNVLGLNFNVTIDNGVISEAMNYQPVINVVNQPRWQDVPGNPAPNPAISPGGSARFTAININAFGLKNDNATLALDQGYAAQSNTTILGYVDFSNSHGGAWITVDTLGIAIQGGSPADLIHMGFGDDPVRAGGAPGTRSSVADALLGIPEPGTMLLLTAGALGVPHVHRYRRVKPRRRPNAIL